MSPDNYRTIKTAVSKLYPDKPQVTFVKPPQPVGYWVLYPGGLSCTQFAMYERPTDEQIKNTEALLGWGWREAT